MASERKPLDWFRVSGGDAFVPRVRAGRRPTWILNYSWDGDKDVDKREAMMNLAMSQIMDGREFLGCAGTFDGRVERSADAEENLLVDSGA